MSEKPIHYSDFVSETCAQLFKLKAMLSGAQSLVRSQDAFEENGELLDIDNLLSMSLEHMKRTVRTFDASAFDYVATTQEAGP